ncbi:hypothetical protein JHK82_053228 [Glycine max]|nr:hypothetical protein JHK82_053228 [Glycine max]
MAVLEIPDKEGAGAALNAANLKHVGFLELEFTNSVSWETTEAEAFLLLSHLSTPSRILFDTTKGKDHEALEEPMTRGILKKAQHSDEDATKGKDHEALKGPMTKGRLKQAQYVIERRLVICIVAIDDD